MTCKKFLWLGILAASVFAFTACGDDDGGAKETNCADGIDNDGDNRIDCVDPDCAGSPACSNTEICDNGIDDDGDGFSDCADSACASDPACTGTQETNCSDGIDDDGDGFTDCDDSDCAGSTDCQAGNEDCDNGIDDDGDGYTDCDDVDCNSDPACQTGNEDCDNGIDDDQDGFTDCQDTDCTDDPACAAGGDLSCQAINYCYACCVSGDTACLDACKAAGSSDAQTQDDAIVQCLTDNCYDECTSGTSEQCNTCAETNCSSELDACDWAPAGTSGCVDLSNCLGNCNNTTPPNTNGTGDASTCPGDAGIICYNDCFGQSTQPAIDALFDYSDCQWTNCETECGSSGNQTDCQTCVEQNCATEATTCQQT